MASNAKPHGHFLAGEAGELAGVSGNTIGQWARWEYIRASQSDGDPHVYSVEDVAEAAIVRALLERGVRHRDVRRAIKYLDDYGDWPSARRRWPRRRTAASCCCARTARSTRCRLAAGS